MFDVSFLSSRKTKEKLLLEVIKKLSITDIEKDIYTLSLEVLEDTDFEEFYNKIVNQISDANENNSRTIAPLTSTLL